MIELNFNGIVKFYGVNKILNKASFDIKSGEKIGLIGRNGTGKTTIFKIIKGIEDYTEGNFSIRKSTTIGYLDQIPDRYNDLKVMDVLNSAFDSINKVKNELTALEQNMSNSLECELEKTMKKYGELQNKYEALGGYDIEEKLSKICIGLKIDEVYKKRDFKSLSGGEKTTVMFAKILLQNPDILLLDEPSNHLDLQSIEWLEEYLKEYNGAVLIISHDRYFLDNVVGKIIELERGEISVYHGNYTYYLEEKERRLQELLERYKNNQKKINEMEEAIKRFRIWGAKRDSEEMYRKAKVLEKRLEKFEKVDKPFEDNRNINVNFDSSRSGNEVIKIKNISKSFGNKKILNKVNLDVFFGESVAILGKNGSGKSTLMKLILNQYNSDSGEIKLGSRVKIGYLEQDVIFDDEEKSVLDTYSRLFNLPHGEARNALAKFLFIKDDVFKKIKNLSGGEKSRLKLCILMNQDINMLLLDEPTNHLDISTREDLEHILLNFKGTILFISHDRYFINKIAKRITELKDSKLINYIGNYDYYKEKKIEEKNNIKEKKVNENKINKNEVKRKENKKINVQYVEKLEKQIKNFEESIEEVNRKIEIHSSDYVMLSELIEEKKQLEKELDIILQKWIAFE